jgi:hypothetical protein
MTPKVHAAIAGNYHIKQMESGLYSATQPMLSTERLGRLRSEYFDVMLLAGGNEYRACKVQFRQQGGALAVYVHLFRRSAPTLAGSVVSNCAARPERRITSTSLKAELRRRGW